MDFPDIIKLKYWNIALYYSHGTSVIVRILLKVKGRKEWEQKSKNKEDGILMVRKMAEETAEKRMTSSRSWKGMETDEHLYPSEEM